MSSSTVTNLLLLGSGSDPLSERGVTCAGEIPAASDPDLVARAKVARAAGHYTARLPIARNQLTPHDWIVAASDGGHVEHQRQ